MASRYVEKHAGLRRGLDRLELKGMSEGIDGLLVKPLPALDLSKHDICLRVILGDLRGFLGELECLVQALVLDKDGAHLLYNFQV